MRGDLEKAGVNSTDWEKVTENRDRWRQVVERKKKEKQFCKMVMRCLGLSSILAKAFTYSTI